MVLDLTYESIKFTYQQFKENLSNVVFQKLNIGDHWSFNDEKWDYGIFETYQELYNFVEENMSEQLENLPSEEMM